MIIYSSNIIYDMPINIWRSFQRTQGTYDDFRIAFKEDMTNPDS